MFADILSFGSCVIIIVKNGPVASQGFEHLEFKTWAEAVLVWDAYAQSLANQTMDGVAWVRNQPRWPPPQRVFGKAVYDLIYDIAKKEGATPIASAVYKIFSGPCEDPALSSCVQDPALHED